MSQLSGFKILILTHFEELIGGVEIYLSILIKELYKNKNDLRLVIISPSKKEKPKIFEAHHISHIWYFDQTHHKKIIDEIKEWQPHLAYSQGLIPHSFEKSITEITPTFLFAHNYSGVCVSGRKLFSFPNYQMCKCDFGISCWINYFPRRCGGINPLKMIENFFYENEKHKNLKKYRSLFVGSHHMKSIFEKINTTHLISLPITENKQNTLFQTKTSSRSKLLYVGRFTKMKGVHHLGKTIKIAQLKLNRKLTLTLAGEGIEKKSLKQELEKNEIDHQFLGWVDIEKKNELYKTSDLLLVPSLWPEPFGLVGMEAGSWGVPSVGYNVGGITDWLISGKTGEIATAHSIDGFGEAIAKVLENEDYYKTLCHGAFEKSREYLIENHMKQLEKIWLKEICITND